MNFVIPQGILIGAIAASLGMIAGGLTGYFLAKRILATNEKEKQDRREAVHSALEIFRPFHWGILHLAILTERYRQNEKFSEAEQTRELIEAYSNVLTTLLEEYKVLLENRNSYDYGRLNALLPVDLTQEMLKIVRALGEVGVLAQRENNIRKCFELVEAAYEEASAAEKKLLALYRKSD